VCSPACVFLHRQSYKEVNDLLIKKSNNIFKVEGPFAIAEEVWNVGLNHTHTHNM